MTLNIQVYDTITTCDSYSEALKIITEAINTWFDGDQKKPLVITLSKDEDRGPPALKISVADSISAEGGLA